MQLVSATTPQRMLHICAKTYLTLFIEGKDNEGCYITTIELDSWISRVWSIGLDLNMLINSSICGIGQIDSKLM